ncbi:MAG: hypothetical protein CM1200mP9_00440 [Gammaproteobacteria bacterium]|nr:MAG: hypothetical protein CM1200mP9_00440 [Gammaproteobacteria bacterium]
MGSTDRLHAVIRDELNEIRENYGDDRRTEILSSQMDLTVEDLITEEDLVVTVSHLGTPRPSLWMFTKLSAVVDGGVWRQPSTMKTLSNIWL